jgi:hypothetical protein
VDYQAWFNKNGLGKFSPPPSKTAKPRKARKTSTFRNTENGGNYFERRREREIEALDYERRRHQRYLDARAARLSKLVAAEAGAGKYLLALERVSASTSAIGHRDVDADVASLARRLGLRSIASDYDKFLLVEETAAWIERIEKRDDVWCEDDADLFPSRELVEDTALHQLKQELGLR